MTTQTLRGMQEHKIFHWRGDPPSVESFNATYRDLLGGSLQPEEDMQALAAYLFSLRHHPNPNCQLDRTLPLTFGDGNPTRGRDLANPPGAMPRPGVTPSATSGQPAWKRGGILAMPTNTKSSWGDFGPPPIIPLSNSAPASD